MEWYFYIALAAIVMQFVFLYQCNHNYRYALANYNKKRSRCQLKAALIVPCKGLDPAFKENITSFFRQDHEDHLLLFVVADKSDPAYEQLCKLKEQLSQTSKAKDVQVLVAGRAESCSQKIHNLLHCYHRIGDDVAILAFADSDACVRDDWLTHIVWPLRGADSGAATGYRWFVPKTKNLATLALSALNAKVAQLLGRTRLNQAWGGSMAIRVDVFRQVGLDKIWPKALSDDLSLSYAVRKTRRKIVFVPACLVASYESTTWARLFEFARRQFLITRVYAPRTWWLGLLGSLYSVLGLYGGAALAVYAGMTAAPNLPLFAAVPVLFLAGHFVAAVLRQKMAAKLLEKDLPRMKFAMAVDILGSWLWSPLLLFFILSSAFGRTITWRGIRYKLLGPTETILLKS